MRTFGTISIAMAALSGLAPAALAQISVVGNTVVERQAQPGATYTGTFVVSNASSAPEEARLYQTDYSATASGRNDYAPPGSQPRSNARWVAIATPRVTIPPKSTRTVSFTVSVPLDASLRGTYWSMLMVEGIPRGSAASASRSAQRQVEVGITARIRYAVQIVTDLGAAVTPAAKFESPVVYALANGSRVLQFDVQNTGMRGFIPVFTVELYDAQGNRVTTGKASREMTYPGDSLRQRFDLGRVPPGHYRAIVTMDAGDDVVLGAQYNLTL